MREILPATAAESWFTLVTFGSPRYGQGYICRAWESKKKKIIYKHSYIFTDRQIRHIDS